jgi:glutathione S-transferase
MPAVGMLNHERFVKRIIGGGDPDPQVIRRGEELVKENCRVLDRQLEGRTWIVGDTLTLADLALGAALASIETARLPVRDFVHVMSWFARIQELEAWKRTAA